MRTWLWTLLLAIVAVALAVLLRQHAGNVLLLVAPWRIEMSLTLAVLLLLASFVVLYAALRLVAWLVAIPERVRAWRGRRALARDQGLIEQGTIGMLEGRYTHAEKNFGKLYTLTHSRTRRVLGALSAARAAHHVGEFVRRDRMLAAAREDAGGDQRLQEASAAVAADLLLDQGQAQQALEVLAPLQEGGARHLHTLRLLLRAEKALDHHERVFNLARSLLRRHAIDRSEAMRLIDQAGAARLRAGTANGDGWRLIWKEIRSEERLLPHIALAASAAFEAAGDGAEAGRILEAAIADKFNPVLVEAYANCQSDQVPRRLAKAEIWLQQRPDDANLLVALGQLCLNGQLWGQAERYLQLSLMRRDDPQSHVLLGSLYDRLNRTGDAVRHWRLATAARTTLPVLAAETVLPAADTGADPDRSRVDAGGTYGAPLAEVPVVASEPVGRIEPPPAIDYAIDHEAYVDNAPIPVAALETPEPNPPTVNPITEQKG